MNPKKRIRTRTIDQDSDRVLLRILRGGSIPLSLSIVVAVTFLLYANSIQNGYALDDEMYTTENKFVQEGLKGIPEIVTTDAFLGYRGAHALAVLGGRYRPLSIITFAIEHDISGDNPHVSHAINILLYALSGVVLFMTLRILQRTPEGDGSHPSVALIASLLFVAHPVHTEAVANIKGRDEILSLLLSLLSLYTLVKYVNSRKIGFLILSSLVFFLALFSKENAVTFIGAIALALCFFTNADGKRILSAVVPLMLAAGAFFILRQHFAGRTEPAEITEVLNNAYVYATPSQKYATIAYTLGRYLLLLVFPHPLTHDYSFNQISLTDWGHLEAIVPFIVYLAIGLYAVGNSRKKAAITFGIFYYFITLSIVSNIFFPIGTTMAERFLFMPSVGFVLLLAVFLGNVSRFASSRFNLNSTYLLTLISMAIVSAYGCKTISRNLQWKDNLTLFSADVENSPNSAKVHAGFAEELLRASKKEIDPLKKNSLQERSLLHFRRALEIHPTFADAEINLGVLLADQGKTDEAIACYSGALRSRPGDAMAHFDLATALQKQGHVNQAIEHYSEALRLEPDYAEAHGNLGITLFEQGRIGEAIDHYSEALRIKPDLWQARYNLGIALAGEGKYGEALAQYAEVLRLKPDLQAVRQEIERVTKLQIGAKVH